MTAREAILSIVADKFKITTARLCLVVSVDTETNTAELTTFDTEATLTSVRLQADKGTGMLLIPKVGSMVVAVEVARFEYAILLYSELESVQFLDGTYGGLVKVADLVTKLNALENKVNSIISTFNSHVHTGVTAGGASTAVTPTTVSGTLSNTSKTDLENTLVTHGKV